METKENETLKALRDAVILIPSLEPDERLPAYIQKLTESGFGHVVVVDDGSSAPYQEIFSRIERIAPQVIVLHHDVNHGKGVALKTGYKWIQENLPEISGVITADADGQHTVPDCVYQRAFLPDVRAVAAGYANRAAGFPEGRSADDDRRGRRPV